MKAAVFDFDGTLVDSMPTWAGKMLHLLDAHHIAYPADIIRTITPLGDRLSAEYFIRELGLVMSVPDILSELDAYALPRYRDSILPKEGVRRYLEALDALGITMCVLTASPQKMLRPCLARNGLLDFFAFTWCCDDLGLSKTQPEIYARVCAELDSRPEDTAFFDDNLLALTTAAAAGMETFGVYDASSAKDAETIQSICRHYLKSFNEL